MEFLNVDSAYMIQHDRVYRRGRSLICEVRCTWCVYPAVNHPLPQQPQKLEGIRGFNQEVFRIVRGTYWETDYKLSHWTLNL